MSGDNTDVWNIGHTAGPKDVPEQGHGVGAKVCGIVGGWLVGNFGDNVIHRRYTGNRQLLQGIVSRANGRNVLIGRDNFFHPRYSRPL